MDDRRQRHDAGRLGELRKVREHERADPTPLPGVGHGESQLGAVARPLWHEAGMGDHVAIDAGGRNEADAAVDEPARRAGGAHAPAQEAKPVRLGRQPVQEHRHGFDVGGDGGSHVDRGAVAQDDVNGTVARHRRGLGLEAVRGVGEARRLVVQCWQRRPGRWRHASVKSRSRSAALPDEHSTGRV
jgi:hypothetical protein